jgi:molybdopterin-guanine dinucleotide biosynthesis protein B
MRVVAVVGPSDAGKTTLVERLVPALGDRGRVATVKSIHHDIEVDDAGTDTHRHRTAGAETVVGVTPSLTFSVETRGKGDDEDGALRRILGRLEGRGFDYVCVEGFAASPVPKLLVGDPPPERIGGRVVRRVTAVETVDVDALADEIDGLDEWTA